MIKTIGILGAGAAGLATAKTLKQYGFQVTVFDSKDRLGGVWTADYHGLSIQKPRPCYGFPDYPWPKDSPRFPTAAQVREYFEGYAKHFGINTSIQLNTRVVSMRPSSENGWEIDTEGPGGKHSHSFDFFVMAPGIFNIPNRINWDGGDRFKGTLLHSSEHKEPERFAEKNVVIVGYGRSAMALAVDAAQRNSNVTLVHRSIRWGIPEKVAGLIPTHFLFYARWPTLFAPLYQRPGWGARLVHKLRLTYPFWAFFEWLLTLQFGLKRIGLVPPRPIVDDLYSNLYVAPKHFFPLVKAGKIKTIQAEVASVTEGGVTLDGGESIDAELIIQATGWKQEYPFLPTELRTKLVCEDGLYLYRHIIHPTLPNAAFVGMAQGLNSATCYAMQAEWLGHMLSGECTLPDEEEQLHEIEGIKTWLRGFVNAAPNRAHIINLHQSCYIDDLMKDMRLRTRRKLLLDNLLPYDSAAFANATRKQSDHAGRTDD